MEWDPDDQAKAIAWFVMEEAKCPNCGTIPDEWLTVDGLPLIPPRYEADFAHCSGCEQIEARRRSVKELAAGQSVVLRRADPKEFPVSRHSKSPARITD